MENIQAGSYLLLYWYGIYLSDYIIDHLLFLRIYVIMISLNLSCNGARINAARKNTILPTAHQLKSVGLVLIAAESQIKCNKVTSSGEGMRQLRDARSNVEIIGYIGSKM